MDFKALFMKQNILLGLALMLALPASLHAETAATRYPGYLTEPDGELVRNGYNQCWRTVEWRPELALAECEPEFIQIRKKLALEEEKKVKKKPRDAKPLVEEKAVEGNKGIDMVMSPEPPAATTGAVVVPSGALASIPLPAPPPPPQRFGVETVYTPLVLNSDASFRFGDDKLTSEGRDAVTILAASLKNRNPLELRITIVGHTDRVGSPQANLQLSKRRADAVKKVMVEEGLPATVISAEGKGSAEPVTRRDDCSDKLVKCELIDCLRPDRRVEVQVRGRVESGKKLVPLPPEAPAVPASPAP